MFADVGGGAGPARHREYACSVCMWKGGVRVGGEMCTWWVEVCVRADPGGGAGRPDTETGGHM